MEVRMESKKGVALNGIDPVADQLVAGLLAQAAQADDFAARRVTTYGLKGNRIFWTEENAEAMLLLRGLVLSGPWNEVFATITECLAADRRLDWKWQSPDMPAELKAGTTIAPSKPKPTTRQASYDKAA